MPAHDPPNKDKTFNIHILVEEKKPFLDNIPDGHARVKFYWHGGTRQWEIEGLVEPESPFKKLKHNWETHDTLPQGQGDTIMRFLKWVQYLTEETPTPETTQSSVDSEEEPLS